MSSYTIRPATQDERDRFVRSTWRRSFAQARTRSIAGTGRRDYFAMRGGAQLRDDIWLNMHEREILVVLRGFRAKVVVAAVGDECLGWVAFGDGQIHYVYVAPKFRRRGIGRDLLKRAVDDVGRVPFPTHMTYEGEALLASLREKPRTHSQQPAEAEAAHE